MNYSPLNKSSEKKGFWKFIKAHIVCQIRDKNTFDVPSFLLGRP